MWPVAWVEDVHSGLSLLSLADTCVLSMSKKDPGAIQRYSSKVPGLYKDHPRLFDYFPHVTLSPPSFFLGGEGSFFLSSL